MLISAGIEELPWFCYEQPLYSTKSTSSSCLISENINNYKPRCSGVYWNWLHVLPFLYIVPLLCEFGEVHDHSMQCGVIKKIQHQGKTRFEKNNFLIFYYSANINRNAKSWNKSQIALLMAETNLAHIRITSTDKLEINARAASCPTQTVKIRCQLSIPVLSLSTSQLGSLGIISSRSWTPGQHISPAIQQQSVLFLPVTEKK